MLRRVRPEKRGADDRGGYTFFVFLVAYIPFGGDMRKELFKNFSSSALSFRFVLEETTQLKLSSDWSYHLSHWKERLNSSPAVCSIATRKVDCPSATEGNGSIIFPKIVLLALERTTSL